MSAGMRYQPYGPARLSPSSGLNRGVVCAIPLTGTSYTDAADGKIWVPKPGSVQPIFEGSPRGVGLNLKGAGAAYVSRAIPAPVSLSTTQPITLRFRVYFRVANVISGLMSWGTTAGDGAPRFYARLTSSSQLNFYYGGGYRYSSPIVANREYLVTHTFDGSLQSTYVNGVLIGSAASGWGGNAASFFLGSGFDAAQGGTDYLISDFVAWNRALSPQEVANDAQSPWMLYSAPDESRVAASAAPTHLAGATFSSASASSALSTAIRLAGSGAAAASASSSLTTAVTLAASVSAVAAASGSLTSQISLAAASVALVSVTGSLTTAIPFSGSAVSSSSAIAALTTGSGLAAAIAAQASASASLTTTISLASTAAAQSATGAALTTQIPLAGSTASAAAASAGLSTQVRLASSALAQVSAGSSLSTSVTLAGTASAAVAVSSVLSTSILLAGGATSSASASASLTAGGGLQSAATSHATAAGNLTTQIQLAGNAASQAAAGGTLASPVTLGGHAGGQAAASGSLTTSIPLSASVGSSAVLSSNLTTSIRLSGGAGVNAQIAGALSGATLELDTYINSDGTLAPRAQPRVGLGPGGTVPGSVGIGVDRPAAVYLRARV